LKVEKKETHTHGRDYEFFDDEESAGSFGN